MPYVIERWPGGMLTNFPTIRKAVKKMATIDKLTNDGTYILTFLREKFFRFLVNVQIGQDFGFYRWPDSSAVCIVRYRRNERKYRSSWS